ncbi:unnamed protein product [Cylindrotheca closterium]|uniref:DUF6824 domain-containing protein n=1 Tax=Cylindrotheca closterium TaxID=2856 RepID=A0AAD2PUF8_9STRA|nr:unnamed protein product [Cylindrotheca closterium]
MNDNAEIVDPTLINPNDVLSHRGKGKHEGNRILRETIIARSAEFHASSLERKKEILDEIVLGLDGRFLKWDSEHRRYFVMTKEDAVRIVRNKFFYLRRPSAYKAFPYIEARPPTANYDDELNSRMESMSQDSEWSGFVDRTDMDEMFDDEETVVDGNKALRDEDDDSAKDRLMALLNDEGGEQLAQTILSIVNSVDKEEEEATLSISSSSGRFGLDDQAQDTLKAAKRSLQQQQQQQQGRQTKRARRNAPKTAKEGEETKPAAEVIEAKMVEDDDVRSVTSSRSDATCESRRAFNVEDDMPRIKIEEKIKMGRKKARKTDREYTGTTLDGKPHGIGFMTYDNGRLLGGHWLHGVFQGQGFAIYENDDKCFGSFLKNKVHGIATYMTNSTKYVGQFHKKQRHGKGRFNDVQKGTFDGDFVDGRFEGLGVHTGMNGAITQGRFENWKIKEHFNIVPMDVSHSHEPQAMLEQLNINRSPDESDTIEKTGDQIVLDTATVLTPEQRLDQKLQAKGARNPEVALTYNSIARVLLKDARLEKDPELYEAAIRQYQKVLPIHGPEHISTAGTYDNIGNVLREQGKSEEAMKQYQKGLEIKLKVNGADDISIAETHDNIGHVMREQGKSKKAMEQYKKGLEIKLKVLGQEHSSTADSYFCIGGVSSDQDMNEVALENYEQALNIFKKVNGPEHPSIALTHHEIANVLCNQGKWEHASERYFKALVIKLKALGPAHYSTATTYHCIGNVLCNQGRYYEALERYQTALEIKSKACGREHSSTISTYQCIGNVLRSQGRYEAAMHQYEKVLKIQLKVYGPENASTAATYHSIGNALYNQGRYDEAMQHHQRSLDIKSKVYGPEHPATASTYQEIGTILSKQGKTGEAMRQIQKGLDIFLRVNGSEHSSTAAAHQAFGEVLQQLGRIEESSVQFEKALSIFRNNLGDNHPRVAMVYNCIAKDLAQTGHQNKAVELLEKAVKIQLKNSRDDHPDLAKIYATMSDISNTEDWERDGNQAGFQALDDVLEVPEEVPILEVPILENPIYRPFGI